MAETVQLTTPEITLADIARTLRKGVAVASLSITPTPDAYDPLQLVITDSAGATVVDVGLTLDEARGLRDEWIAAVAAAEKGRN